MDEHIYIDPQNNGRDYLFRSKIRMHNNGKTSSVKEDAISFFAKELCLLMSKGYFRIGEDGNLLMFDKVRYVDISDKIDGYIMDLVEHNGWSLVYTLPRVVSVVKKYIMSSGRIPIFENDRRYVAFNNGLYDLEMDRFIKATEDKCTSTYIPHDFDNHQRGSDFQLFLHHVLPDEDVRMVLQEICGAIFVDRFKYSIEYSFYLYGSGSNGKSVFSNLLEFMLGVNNISNAALYELTKHPNSLYNRASIIGKLLNTCSDLSDDDFSGGEYKRLMSSENVSCRHPQGRTFYSNRIPLFLSNVNKMPMMSDQTHGGHRRTLVVPFLVTISKDEQDLMLLSKLKNEVSVFIRWVFEGRRRLINNNGKFTDSKLIEEQTKSAKINSSSALSFIYESGYFPTVCGKYDYTFEIKALRDLYSEYCSWMEDNGTRTRTKGKKTFKNELESEGFPVYLDHNKSPEFKLFIRVGMKEDMDVVDLDAMSVKERLAYELEMEERRNVEELPF